MLPWQVRAEEPVHVAGGRLLLELSQLLNLQPKGKGVSFSGLCASSGQPAKAIIEGDVGVTARAPVGPLLRHCCQRTACGRPPAQAEDHPPG